MPPVAAAGLLILGLDPGSVVTGYGLIEKRGGTLRPVASGAIRSARPVPLELRLAHLVTEVEALLDRFSPQAAVIERAFHGRSTHSLIVLAEARGAILAVLGRRQLEVWEYSPAEVKSAVTGNGHADKSQVARMVHLLLVLGEQALPRDATDALAVAICHAQRSRLEQLVRALPPAPPLGTAPRRRR